MLGEPGRHGADVVRGHGPPVLEAQKIFQKHLQREGKAGNARQSVLFRFRQAEIFVLFASHVEGAAAFEAIDGNYRFRGHGRASKSMRGQPGSAPLASSVAVSYRVGCAF